MSDTDFIPMAHGGHWPQTGPSPRANRILGALPLNDYLSLEPHLEPVEVLAGQLVHSAGTTCAHAHFPVDCTVTLVSATRDGEMSELALIGREGLVGLPGLLGGSATPMQSVVLRPGLAYRLPAAVFSQAIHDLPALQALAMRYVQNLMLQMAQGVVCSLHHSVLQRLSTWLMYHHTVTASPQVRATHETIAHMLGVRRESITQAAGHLHQAGCISTSRGRITIHDPKALRGHVCECFSTVEDDHRQLWENLSAPENSRPAPSVLLSHGDGLPAERAMGDGHDAPRQDGRYADIYDFAPVGLLSVDSQGRLIEVNMAAAILLGIARSHCQAHRFADFLQPESRQSFEDFHREVLSGRCRRHCELGLLPAGHRSHAVIRLDAVVDESGEESRMVMMDVTDNHQQRIQLQQSGTQTPAAALGEGTRRWSMAQVSASGAIRQGSPI